MPKTESPEKIEQQLQQLQKIVDKLERGKDDLDTSLQDYERGIQIAKTCKQQLDNATQKIEILSAENEFIEYEQDEDEDEY